MKLSSRKPVEVVITTLSLVMFFCAIFWSPSLGPYYSHRRFGTIYANLVVSALIAGDSVIYGTRPWRLAIAAAITALCWAYLAIVNSVV